MSAASGRRWARQKGLPGVCGFLDKKFLLLHFRKKLSRFTPFNTAPHSHFLFVNCSFGSQNEEAHVQECFT